MVRLQGRWESSCSPTPWSRPKRIIELVDRIDSGVFADGLMSDLRTRMRRHSSPSSCLVSRWLVSLVSALHLAAHPGFSQKL